MRQAVRNYYQELGVTRSASLEEIRNAYKRLARQVHPDLCVKDSARPVAELQMKRLNAMVATLADPVKRARYDSRMAFSTPRRTSLAPGRVVWPACGAFLATALLFAFAQLRDSPRTNPAGLPPPVITRRTERPRPQRRIVRPARTTAKLLLPESAPEIQTLLPPLTVNQLAPVLKLDAPLPPPPPAVQFTLAGRWVFVPSRHTSTAGLYPPVYIELHLTEASGVLHGRYRGRYQIADRAISPNVAFQFEGEATAGGNRFAWVGSGNAKGQVTLRLLSSGALEVSWVAEQ